MAPNSVPVVGGVYSRRVWTISAMVPVISPACDLRSWLISAKAPPSGGTMSPSWVRSRSASSLDGMRATARSGVPYLSPSRSV